MLQFMLKSVRMAYVASDKELHRKPLPIIFIEILWREWPSGLRCCSKNQKAPGLNPARCSAKGPNFSMRLPVTFELKMY